MLIKAFACLALTLVAAPPLRAQTLAQKEYMARQESAFADVKPDVDAACGTTLSTTIDWPSFLKDEIGFHSVASSCADPLAMMRSMCADPLAKKAIAEKVQAYTCSFGGPGKRAHVA